MSAHREVGGHTSTDATIHDLPPLPAALMQDGPKPTRCPCGHPLDEDGDPGTYRCLNGLIYGPCGNLGCDGPCADTHGYCNADICACPEEDA